MKTNPFYSIPSGSNSQKAVLIVTIILSLFSTIGIQGQSLPPVVKNAQNQSDQTFIDKLAKDYTDLKQNHGLVIGIIKNGQKQV